MKTSPYPVRVLCLSALLALTAVVPSSASAATVTTLVDESFANGATNSTWYASGATGSINAGTPGQLTFDTTIDNGQSNASEIRHVLTYFTPKSLTNVGDSLKLSLSLSTDNATPNSTIGFAFYNSNGNRIAANGLGQTNSLYSGYRGYRVAVRTTLSNSTSPFELTARAANNNTLGNTGTAHASSFGISGPSSSHAWGDETVYDVTYTITRTTADTLSVSFEITGGEFADYTGSWSITSTSDPFFATFDTFAINVGNAGTFNSITLYEANLTHTSAIPEPASAATLTGLGALGLLACKRRRR